MSYNQKILTEVLTERPKQTKNYVQRLTEAEHKFLKEVEQDTGISKNAYIRLLIKERMYEYE
jgi:hypothetical protein